MAPWLYYSDACDLCSETALVRCVVVYNPKSGSALSASELRARFTTAGIEITKLVAISKGFEDELQSAIQSGDTIAVIGGDGTVSSVAALVAGTDATLAPLPGGTLNHFTKDLSVSQDLDEALAKLVNATPSFIDIARVNDRYFINNSSVGLYPATLHHREEIESNVGKWPAAVWASLRALIRLKTYDVEIDGQATQTPFIFIGNNRYALDELGFTSRTTLDEGVLTVFVAHTSSRLVLLKVLLMALIGRAKDVDEFDEYHPESIKIATKKSRISVSADGEVMKLRTPLEYEIQHKMLKVLV